MFDKSKPYAVTYGLDTVTFHQNGVDYSSNGTPLGKAEGSEKKQLTQSERMKEYWRNKKVNLS